MTIEEAVRFIDLVEAELAAGRIPLQLRAGDRAVLLRGSREERRRLLAERHFEWARRSSFKLRCGPPPSYDPSGESPIPPGSW